MTFNNLFKCISVIWVLSGCASTQYQQDSKSFDPKKLTGTFYCSGYDEEADKYIIDSFIIKYDHTTLALDDVNFVSYLLEISGTSMGGDYKGSMLINTKTMSGANYISGNKLRPKDNGPGIVNLDSFNDDGKLQQLTIIYYEPHYHVNGKYTCWRKD